ncbi:hypothetical protein D3C75_1272370 [compost metagenome]
MFAVRVPFIIGVGGGDFAGLAAAGFHRISDFQFVTKAVIRIDHAADEASERIVVQRGFYALRIDKCPQFIGET